MIESSCTCGARFEASEASLNQPLECSSCGQSITALSAEALADGAGAADFDAALLIENGTDSGNQQVLLGGCLEIELGKLPERHLCLPGKLVSRLHCKLVRLDFGPSRWKIVDNRSTNGVIVNGQRITEHELRHGDRIVLGDFTLTYAQIAPAPIEEFSPASGGGAATVTAPPALRAAPAGTLAYATPKKHIAPLLGDCDINWVMKLRNASTLMVWVINVNLLSAFFLPDVLAIEAGVEVLVTLMSFAAAWLLTAPEPGAPESTSWFTARLFLRGFACITLAGQLVTVLGTLMEGDEFETSGFSMVTLVGLALSLALVPQTGLFLYYLRKLAVRLPNPALALNIAIVMIGLPVLLAMTMGAAFFAARSGSAGMLILTGLGGLLGLLVFRIWYLILLIWFNRSFS